MLKICPAQNFQFCNIFESLFIVAPIVCGGFFCLVFLFCSICVLSSFAITSLGKRELVDASEKTYYKRNIITRIGYNTSCNGYRVFLLTSTHRIY